MKKIFTLILVLFCFGATSVLAQKNTIEKQKLIQTKGNLNLNIYYPKFLSGEYVDTLNKTVYDMFTKGYIGANKPIVTNDEQLREYFVNNGKRLAEIGMTKSIAPIDYVHVSGWYFFQNRYVASMLIDQYISAGTAHPNVVCQDVNLNMKNGMDFDPFDIVKDTAKLMDIAAVMFCKQNRLPKNAIRLQTGLFCELADLPMSNVCGFTSKGFVLFYNRGEIANHRVPAIHILIPYAEFKHLLPADFFENVIQVQDGEVSGEAYIKKLTRGDNRYVRKKQRPRY